MRLSQIKPYIPYIIGGLMLMGVLGYYLFSQTLNVGATILYPSGGGTGIGTNPTYGQMLVGNAGGTYTLTATSSLGITATAVENYTGSVSTSTSPTVGHLAMWATKDGWPEKLGSVATGTITCSGSVSCGAGAYVVGSALTITGSGMTSYDAFTHPAAGQSATTSLMLLNGQASTTQLTTTGSTYLATTGGNVGIGTTTPNARLSVEGNITSPFTSIANSSLISIRASSNNLVAPSFIESSNQGALSLGVTANSVAAAIRFWTMDGTMGERVTIKSDGNVGIGTTSPYAALAVNGRGVFNQDIRADFFTATSTTASVFPNASTTLLTVNTQWVNNEICFSTGECMSRPSVSGDRISLYPWNQTSDIATYEGLRTTATTSLSEVDESCAATADYCVGNLDIYVSTSTITAQGPLTLTKIPAGTWQFYAYSYVSNTGGNSYLEFTFYRRVGAVETLMFQATSTDINFTSPGLVQFNTTQPEFAFNPTDRLVVKVRGYTDSGAAKTIHWLYQGAEHYSFIKTPATIASEAVAFLNANNTFSGTNTFNALTTLGNASTSVLTVSGSAYLATTGNVGIGNTNPGYKLDVSGSINLPAASGTDGNGLFISNGNTRLLNYQGFDLSSISFAFFGTNRTYTGSAWSAVGFDATRVGASFQIENNLLRYYQFPASSNTPTKVFEIDASGNVSIPVGTLTVAGLTTLGNSSTTVASFTYASSTAAYFGSLTMTGAFTPNASFGGAYATVNGSAVDVDIELATETMHFTISSSSMSTTTPFGMKKYFPLASTITKVWCSTDVGTSTIQMEERTAAAPNAAGTDILFAGGLACGSGTGQVASSTMANTSIDADDIVVPEILDAQPVGGTKPKFITIYASFTKND